MNLSWVDYMHYGSALVLLLLGIFGQAGGHLAGVTIDPPTCFAAAMGIFAGGLKSGWKAK